MKPCIYRNDIKQAGIVGCTNTDDLVHEGTVPSDFCRVCPYVTPPAKEFFEATAQLLLQKHRREEHNENPKPCVGCLGPKRRLPAGPYDVQFVWPYWHGGANGDEIRFSVRSVETFFEDQAKCTIIGDKPPWFTGHYIPHRRVPKRTQSRSYRDMLTKVWTMATHPEIDDDFIWMMDDIYFVRPFDLEQLQVARAEKWHPSDYNTWQRLKTESIEALKASGYSDHDYATHMPHYVEKSKLVQLFEEFNLHEKTLLWEVLYGNRFLPYPVRARPFFARVGVAMEPDQLQIATRRSTVLNHTAGAWCEGMRNYLLSLMPDAATCESDVQPHPAIKPVKVRVVKRRPKETHRSFLEAQR